MLLTILQKKTVNKIKKQNPLIKDKLDKGAKLSIIFTRKPKEDGANNFFQVVARVDDDIRQARLLMIEYTLN